MHTAKPRQPRGTSGTIQAISNINDQSETSETASGPGIAAIVSLTWNPPENHDETAINFYELTLIGTPNNNTNTFFYRATAQQSISSEYVLSEGKYTAVRITVIDLCEQRSEPSQIILSNIDDPLSVEAVATTTESVCINPRIDELNNTIKKQRSTNVGLFIALACTTALCIITSTISIIQCMCSRSN